MDSQNLLRQARLNNKITIDEIAQRTKLPRSLVEKIDEGRLGELPAGIYGRAYVRAFASAVGANAAEALEACAVHLVDAPDPLPGLREILRERTTPSLGALIAERLRALRSGDSWFGPLRVPAARYAAASADALVLFVTHAVVVAVISTACGVPVEAMLREAGPAVTVVCAFTSIAYFLLLAGVGGQTPGMRLCGLEARHRHRPLDLRVIGSRAIEAALGESSILVDWLCTSEVPATRESTV